MAVQISRAPLDVSQVGSPSRGPIFKGATRTPLVQREICCVWSLDALPPAASGQTKAPSQVSQVAESSALRCNGFPSDPLVRANR